MRPFTDEDIVLFALDIDIHIPRGMTDEELLDRIAESGFSVGRLEQLFPEWHQ